MNSYLSTGVSSTKFTIRLSSFFLFACFVGLFLVSSFRVFGLDSDYYHYLNLYNFEGQFQEETKEFSFVFIRYLLNAVLELEFGYFLAIYAFLGVSLKVLSIRRLSPNSYFSAYIYFFTFFWLHEYTQIRVGVAAALIFLSVSDILKGRLSLFLAKLVLATLFHWSALLALPIYFFRNKSVWFFFGGVFLSIVLAPFSANIVNSLINVLVDYSILFSKYYRSHSGHLEQFPLFNLYSVLLLSIVVISFFGAYRKKISGRVDDVPSLLVSIFCYSTLLYFLFAGLHRPVLAFRSSELFMVSVIFLLPWLLKVLNYSVIWRIYFLFFPLAFFWHLVSRVNILPYS